MLKRRLIPKLQLGIMPSYRGPKGVLVVTRQFGNIRAIGNPLSQAKIYEAQLADELILVDLVRTNESWEVLLECLENMSENLATPLSVGGGISSFDQVQELLNRGADKIIINTAALENPKLIEDVANSYGRQCVVVSIDVRSNNDEWEIYSDGGKKSTGLLPVAWSKQVVKYGAGEIMITSIDRDGTGTGLELDLINKISSSVTVPIIASGGCGLAQHFVEGFDSGAAAVAAGTFFSQRDQNPMQCRSHIRNAGHPIRLEV